MPADKPRKLTERQQRFVEEYAKCSNASEAARRAGYRGDANTVGPRLLANVGVAAAIKAFGQKRTRRAIATLEERHAFWTRVMRGQGGKGLAMKDRLRASELLARANGEFASVAVVTPPGGAAVVPVDGDDDDAVGPIVKVYMPANGRDSGR